MQYLDDTNEKEVREDNVDMDRRKTLAKLGIMAVAAYAAPLLLKISDAHAKGSGGSGGSGGGSGSDSDGDHGGGSGASGASGGTGASSASSASGATGSNGATGATGPSGSDFSSSQGRGSDSTELINPDGIEDGIEGGV